MRYVVTDRFAIFQAYGALRDMGRYGSLSALLLDGPPGAGKTFLGKTLARITGGRLIQWQATPGCSRRDLLFDEIMATTENPRGDGVLLQAISSSHQQLTILQLDEWDKAEDSIDAFLLNFLSEGAIFLPQFGECRPDPENLLVILTKNDRRDITPPLMRRCRPVYYEWPSLELETLIMQDALPWLSAEACSVLLDVPNRLRANPEVAKAPSVSEMIRLASDLGDGVAGGQDATTLGMFYRSAIAPYPRDRSMIEQSPLFLGSRIREAYCKLNIPHCSTAVAERAHAFLKEVEVS